MSDEKTKAARTIDDQDVSVWIKPDGYYVMLSFNRGEHTFVLSFTDARRLADSLRQAAEQSERSCGADK